MGWLKNATPMDEIPEFGHGPITPEERAYIAFRDLLQLPHSIRGEVYTATKQANTVEQADPVAAFKERVETILSPYTAMSDTFEDMDWSKFYTLCKKLPAMPQPRGTGTFAPSHTDQVKPVPAEDWEAKLQSAEEAWRTETDPERKDRLYKQWGGLLAESRALGWLKHARTGKEND